MTVASETSFVRYTGDGTTVAFTITFPFQEATDIRLFVENTLVTTGFTVTGGSPTGTLTFDTAPANGADIFIRRLVPILQDKAYPTNDTFPSVTHEAALDKLTYISQQLQRNQTLSLSFPESLNITAGVLPAPEDDAILAWDGTTGTIKNGPTTASFETATNTAVAAAATATTQAAIATSAASTATTQAGLSEDNKDYASEWAINPEDDPVSVAAGGDDSTTFSALHWAAKAADSAASVNLPTLGAANTVLQVNTGGTALEYGLVDTNNIEDDAVTVAKIDSGAATDGQVLTADGAGGVAFEDAAGGGGWVPLETISASSDASIDFTSNIDSTYDMYVVVFTGVKMSNDNRSIRLLTGNGGSFDTGASDYDWSQWIITTESGGSGNYSGGADQAYIQLTRSQDIGVTGLAQSGTVYIDQPADASSYTNFRFLTYSNNSTPEMQTVYGGGQRNEAAAHDRLRFTVSDGTISTGTFTLYGLAGA